MQFRFSPKQEHLHIYLGLAVLVLAAICGAVFLLVHHPAHLFGREVDIRLGAAIAGVFSLIIGLGLLDETGGTYWRHASTPDRRKSMWDDDPPLINPATGAPMQGGVDSMGYTFGHGPDDDHWHRPHH